MKTIAADQGLSAGEVITSGFFVGIITGILGITNTTALIHKFTPGLIISIIQFSLGLKMIISGIKYLISVDHSAGQIILNILNVFLLLASNFNNKIPSALIIFIVGIIIILFSNHDVHFNVFKLENVIHVVKPTHSEYLSGFLKGTLTQLPLTLLNSVLSLVELSSSLLPPPPNEPTVVNIKNTSVMIFIMNSFPLFLGAMPSCHGAGGLMSQYSYGARTGTSMIILGIFKVLVSLLFGNSLQEILTLFPVSLLGILLIGGGIELGSHSLKKNENNKNNDSDNENKTKFLNGVFIVSVGTIISTNTLYGYLVSMFLYYLYSTYYLYYSIYSNYSLSATNRRNDCNFIPLVDQD